MGMIRRADYSDLNDSRGWDPVHLNETVTSCQIVI